MEHDPWDDPGVELFRTLDNGGERFEVGLAELEGRVYVRDLYNENSETLEFSPEEIFVGENFAENPDADTKDPLRGNSVLLGMGNNNYIFIGNEMYEFRTKSPIEQFISNVGRSAVPYPYAVTSERDAILFVEKTILTKWKFRIARRESPYKKWYAIIDNPNIPSQFFSGRIPLVATKTYF